VATIFILGARVWVGAAFVVGAIIVLAYHLLRRRHIAHTTLLLLLVFGITFTGVFGAYLNPAPPMDATVVSSAESPGPEVHGKFLGTSTDNQWIVAQPASNDDYEVRLIPISSATQLVITQDKSADDHYRTLGSELWKVIR
jgi:hypothetical protein